MVTTDKILIAQCRYYKGEKENPYKKREDAEPDGMLWYYESCWVRMMQEDKQMIDGQMQEYIYYGLKHFSEDDGVPMSIKSLLFNRYGHWNVYDSDIENFKRWYKKTYLKMEL